jgi:hypothetical protein
MSALITIYGFADSDMLQKFQKDWNEANRTTHKRKDIYVSSEGGYTDVFKVIEETINSDHSRCTLTAVGEIHSCAFEMFYNVKCKRRIMPYCFGMYHFGYDEIKIDEKGKPKDAYDKARFNNLKRLQQYTIDFCKRIGMNAAEIKQIRAGEDVYFQADRLNYFLKQVQ